MPPHRPDDPAPASPREQDPAEVVRLPIEDAIDLHAFAPRDILSVVDEYVREAQTNGLLVVRLIHGRGKGVQRASIHRLLTQHASVEEYWDAPEAHLGATVVRLKTTP